MKIKNVGKFRNELYEAIKDATYWDEVEDTEWVFKKLDTDNKELYEMRKNDLGEYCIWKEFDNGVGYQAIALPNPMHINGTPIYMTVDDEGVDFWRSKEDYFEHCSWVDADFCKNRLSFAMAVMRRIEHYVSKEK